MKKSASKSDLARHISIAQFGVDWMKDFNIVDIGNRAMSVIDNFGGDVAKYSEFYKVF